MLSIFFEPASDSCTTISSYYYYDYYW